MGSSPLAKNRTVSAVIGGVCMALAIGLSFAPLARHFELKTIDARFRLRGPIEQSPDILHIDIDDPSLVRLGAWPWRRDTHATLVEGLGYMQAASVVFDVEFLEPQPVIEGNNPDRKLADAIQGGPPVHLPLGFSGARIVPESPHLRRTSSIEAPSGSTLPKQDQIVLPIAPLTEAGVVTRFGCVDVGEPDSDGIFRRIPIVFRYGERVYLHLGTIAALDHLGIKLEDVRVTEGALEAGDLSIPIDSTGRILVNWPVTGPEAYVEAFEHLSYLKTHAAAAKFVGGEMRRDSPHVKTQETVEGKLCFVGWFARSASDIKPAPNSPMMPGVGIHSAIANMILTRAYVSEIPWVVALLIGLGLGALSTFLCTTGRPLVAAGAVLGGVCLWILIGLLLFMGGVLIPITLVLLLIMTPFAGILPYRLATEERTRGRILTTFERFLDREIVDELIRNPGFLREDAKRIKATVMFTDIEGFSTFAENTPPEVTVKVLNVYLTLVTDAIVFNQGYLDKYLGDGTMAIFGLRPGLEPERAAENACRAARQIVEKTREQKHMFPFGRTRIGIASGEIVSGFIGGVKGSLDFTGIGDVVNVSSRLQAMNKETGTAILLDEASVKLLEDGAGARFLDTVKIRGRKEDVKIYTIDPEAPV